MFQTCDGSDGVAAKLVPLHSLQQGAHTTGQSSLPSTSGQPDIQPADATPPAAAAFAATSACSVIHSVGSQLVPLDEEGNGGSASSMRPLWTASSCSNWQAASPPAAFACLPGRAYDGKHAQVIDLAAVSAAAAGRSLQPASSTVSAEVLAQPTASFLDFVWRVQHSEGADCATGAGDLAPHAGLVQHASPRPLQGASSVTITVSLAAASSAQTVGSQEVLLQQSSADYSIPVGRSSAASIHGSRRRSWRAQGRPLLTAWRHALQNHLPSRSTTPRAAGGRPQAQKGQQDGPAVILADAAQDVRPKWEAALRRGRWQAAPRGGCDENEPVV
jgi:hypothetical protein